MAYLPNTSIFEFLDVYVNWLEYLLNQDLAAYGIHHRQHAVSR